MPRLILPRHRHLLGSTALAVLIAASHPAVAQTEDGFFTVLGRIVFGAGQQKVAIDTPLAVTVLDQADIDAHQATSLRDLFLAIPGIQTTGSTARPLGQAFNIRGIGLTEQPASESRIIVTVDGVPKFYEQYRMGSFFSDPELFKLVEVLRGPAAGTLYGSGAVGGIVNFTTKDAADYLPEGATTTLRSRLGFSGNGDGALGSLTYATRPMDGFEFLGVLNYRNSGDVTSGDGVVLDVTNFTAVSGLAKGTWRLADDKLLRFAVQRWSSDQDDARYAQTGSSAFGTVDRKVVDTTATLSFANPVADSDLLDYTLTLGFSDTTNEQLNSQPGFPSTSPLFADGNYAYKTLTLKAENRTEIGGDGWDGFLTFGAQLAYLTRSAATTVGPLGFHPEGKDTKAGLYAQGEFVFGDRLTIIPGLRADFVDRVPGPLVPGASAVSDVAVSPKIAAFYDISDDWSVFGSWARTERLPTIDELYSASATQAAALTLSKEKAETFELGLAFGRADVFAEGDALQFKLTAFQNTVKNLIQRSPTAVPVYFRNIGAAQFSGVELEGGYEARGGYVRLAYSQVMGIDTDYDYTLSSTPADALSLTLAKRLPNRGLEIGVRSHFVNAISTASRNATSGVITTTDFAAYTTHDVFVDWKPQDGALQGFEFQLAVENLTGASYQNNLDQEKGLGRNLKLTVAKSITW